jgi:hypothetical protein
MYIYSCNIVREGNIKFADISTFKKFDDKEIKEKFRFTEDFKFETQETLMNLKITNIAFIILGTLLTLCTLGVACFSARVRNLFSLRDTRIEVIASRITGNSDNLNSNEKNKLEEEIILGTDEKNDSNEVKELKFNEKNNEWMGECQEKLLKDSIKNTKINIEVFKLKKEDLTFSVRIDARLNDEESSSAKKTILENAKNIKGLTSKYKKTALKKIETTLSTGFYTIGFSSFKNDDFYEKFHKVVLDFLEENGCYFANN